MNPMVRIGFIGMGVLGKGLGLALATRGYPVVAIHSRTRSSAHWLADRIPKCQVLESAQELANAVDLVFITTPDSAISEVAASITWRPDQGAVHCSGALPVSILHPAFQQSVAIGSFHPFQTFAGINGPEDAVSRLSGVTFAISATVWLNRYLTKLALDLGGFPVYISDEDRPLYHASAVLSCGYLVSLLQSAISIWETFGASPQDAMKAIYPLARTTLDNMANHGAQSSVTGPVVRGDAATIQSHLESLSHRAPEFLSVYQTMTQASFPFAAKSGVTQTQLAAMRELIGQYDRRSGECRE